jgi:hypothetical protein
MSLPNVNSIHIHPVHEPPLLLRNLDIIPTHLSLPHLAISRESPVLKPIAPLPLHSIRAILVLVPELHRDLVVGESEELFAQAVGLFFRPLGCQEVFDGGGALQEVGAVAPDAVGGVGFGYSFGVSLSRGTRLEPFLWRGESRRW